MKVQPMWSVCQRTTVIEINQLDTVRTTLHPCPPHYMWSVQIVLGSQWTKPEPGAVKPSIHLSGLLSGHIYTMFSRENTKVLLHFRGPCTWQWFWQPLKTQAFENNLTCSYGKIRKHNFTAAHVHHDYIVFCVSATFIIFRTKNNVLYLKCCCVNGASPLSWELPN